MMEVTHQQQQSNPLEARLPPIFECHQSTVRYIRAGFYLDAIHTTMEGFSKCQVSLAMQRDESTASVIELDSPRLEEKEETNLVMDLSPMDMSINGGKSPQELLLAVMLYNLALSYHLYAASSIDDKIEEYDVRTKEQVAAILGDALHLYEETCFRLHNLDPVLRSYFYRIPAVENNMRHAKLLHLQSR
ncbi:MAG: hypothetical protein SGBAC_013214 [Bacillariaceae sp.]